MKNLSDSEKSVIKLRGRADQHLAKCRDWFKAMPIQMRSELWDAINMTYEDPFTEAATNLAIVTFEKLILDEHDDEREGREL